MKVTIDRSRWMTPDTCPDQDGVLLDSTGYRCCLGFLGQACGVPDSQMRGSSLPGDARSIDIWPAGLFADSPQVQATNLVKFYQWESAIAEINDSSELSAAEREQCLVLGFREVLGCELEFVGEYGEPRFVEHCTYCGSVLDTVSSTRVCPDGCVAGEEEPE